uniref:Uncharacterized protein n=1 Tax=Caenorhabditis tropicalis TaxID=1561998 RepID=A0A1I7TI15_9PELO
MSGNWTSPVFCGTHGHTKNVEKNGRDDSKRTDHKTMTAINWKQLLWNPRRAVFNYEFDEDYQGRISLSRKDSSSPGTTTVGLLLHLLDGVNKKHGL